MSLFYKTLHLQHATNLLLIIWGFIQQYFNSVHL